MLPAIAAVAAVVFVALRRWALAAFLAVGLSIESASYRLTSIVNPRERPDVMRLDGYPADASFPSGHVAAAIVVYGGLALLIGSRISNRWARAGLVVAAVAIVTIVGASRMYRGMHHPIDLAAGVGIGCAALAVMVGASRAATAAAARTERNGESRYGRRPHDEGRGGRPLRQVARRRTPRAAPAAQGSRHRRSRLVRGRQGQTGSGPRPPGARARPAAADRLGR